MEQKGDESKGVPEDATPIKEVVASKVVYYEEDYIENGVITETDEFPEINFKFKPLNMYQSSKLTDQVIKGKSVEGATLATLQMLSKHLVEWDAKKSDGSVINFRDVSELKKIAPFIMSKIARKVRKDRSSPEDDIKAIAEELKNLSGEPDST